MEKRLIALMLVCVAALAGCGGGDNVSGPTPPKLATNIVVPNESSPSFSFDIGYVEAGNYFLADRNNKAVDVVDTKSNTLVAQIPGPFAGVGATTDASGPDGIVGITGTHTIYVGDVGSVKVIDKSARKTINTIAISSSGSRVDKGCYDPDDHLVMYASPGESPPFVTFISTQTQQVVVKLPFNGSSGLEACTYDSRSRSFLINNDGTAANPDGELDVISASSAAAGNPSVSKSFPLSKCAPTGIVLGPNNDVHVRTRQNVYSDDVIKVLTQGRNRGDEERCTSYKSGYEPHTPQMQWLGAMSDSLPSNHRGSSQAIGRVQSVRASAFFHRALCVDHFVILTNNREIKRP
ncbi:MAG: hypothetical protein CPSOU_1704 [uncultured Paraburkholderia sp.]|nr:MAG: hypothetical protein CPSOU_1704 [uncultured Paraburkholderia sp.]